MRTTIFAAAFALVSVPAFAGSSPWTAVPAQPSSLTHFVASSLIWTCSDSGCASVSDTSGALSMSECRALARQVGHLSSFATQKGAFTESRLAECNQAAPTR
jgi:hypothetical protein